MRRKKRKKRKKKNSRRWKKKIHRRKRKRRLGGGRKRIRRKWKPKYFLAIYRYRTLLINDELAQSIKEIKRKKTQKKKSINKKE